MSVAKIVMACRVIAVFIYDLNLFYTEKCFVRAKQDCPNKFDLPKKFLTSMTQVCIFQIVAVFEGTLIFYRAELRWKLGFRDMLSNISNAH